MPPVVDREFRLGIWKIHILHHAAQREVWGLWLLEELAEHGYRLSPGTLYPVLASMERSGWLRRSNRDSGARARRTLRITAAGRRLLEQLRRDVTELHAEVVLGNQPGRTRSATSSLAPPPAHARGKGTPTSVAARSAAAPPVRDTAGGAQRKGSSRPRTRRSSR